MIYFVLEYGGAIIAAGAGGIACVVWRIARDRRKAVDRLVDRLYVARTPDDAAVCRKVIDEVRTAGWRPGWSTGTGPQQQDAPGRVIARSVRRMTKENHER